MSGLVKASLQEIRSDRAGTPIGNAVDVQFNPASLRLALSNHVEGGQARHNQARQFVGKSSTGPSFELQFETADEADGLGAPVSVLHRPAPVGKFGSPKAPGNE